MMKKVRLKKDGVKRGLFIWQNIMGTLLFFALPLCYCVLFSMSATFGRFRFNSFQNYISLFRSEAFLLALKNTFLLLFCFVAVSVVLSLLVVYFMERKHKYSWILLLCSIPMFLPSPLIVSFVQAYEGIAGLSPRLVFGIIFLWRHVGIGSLILHIAACSMNSDWIEVAVLDGASRTRAFFSVEFYYLLPHIKFLFVLSVIGFFRMFRESYLLYGLYPPEEVYMLQNFFFNNFQNVNYQRLSAGATITVVLLLAVNWILLRLGEKNEIV